MTPLAGPQQDVQDRDQAKLDRIAEGQGQLCVSSAQEFAKRTTLGGVLGSEATSVKPQLGSEPRAVKARPQAKKPASEASGCAEVRGSIGPATLKLGAIGTGGRSGTRD